MAIGPVNFQELPAPLRIGVILVGGGGVLATVWAVMSELPVWVGGLIVIGIAAVGLLLILYSQWLKWRKANKARPMEHQMFRTAGASQQGISDPRQLATIDDLRRKFEEGIATFRAAGKSLYSLPWHVILGEPGSGKTEAIRHCGIGFPPGLNDSYQGVGGTINMNWWFTDHGVIIDTAGKMMFEEVHTGGTREWKEFLGLLKKARPHCPINGALLVIPADSLICDDAEKIEHKASQIAQQFDVIQRTLDVRFPVYVVITKSDLINGFREFFDNITDPQLQHQILGWSNPGDMDKPYEPGFVDKYLEEMKVRLFRARLTRLGELLGDDAQDQERPTAEALYAFPHAFEQLGSRLRRYLDLIFSVGSQWSCKPLFFRGIYFTSSMQEGAALDEDLAKALGVPVGSLPEGPVWQRDRAYFLRDLFVNKVFPERGLVTRATNARKQYVRRQATVLGFAAAAVVVLLGLTIYGSLGFRRSVGAVQKSLELAARQKSEKLAADRPDSLKLIDSTHLEYKGGDELPGGLGPRYAYFDYLTARACDWEKNKGITWLFQPLVKWADLKTDLRTAAERVYVANALETLLGVVAEKMAQMPQSSSAWTQGSNEYEALRQFIRLRANGSFDARTAFGPWMKYAQLRNEERYPEQAEKLLLPADSFGPLSLSLFDGAVSAEADQAVENGIRLFNEYWAGASRRQDVLQEINGAAGSAEDFGTAEEEFLAGAGVTNPDMTRIDAAFRKMAEAKSRIDSSKSTLENPRSVLSKWTSVADQPLKEMQDSYQGLLDAFNNKADANHPHLQVQYAKLDDGRKAGVGNFKGPDLNDRLQRIDDRFWTDNLYDRRFAMYQITTDALAGLQDEQQKFEKAAQRAALEQLPVLVKKGEETVPEALRKLLVLRRDAKLDPKAHRVSEANDAATALLKYGRQRLRQAVLGWWLQNMPREEIGLRDYIEKESQQEYDPGLTREVLAAWESVRWAVQGLPASPERQRLEPTDNEYRRYAAMYAAYWRGAGGMTRLRKAIPHAPGWEAQLDELRRIAGRPEDTLRALASVGAQLQEYQKCVKGYLADGSSAALEKKWALLADPLEQQKYRRVVDAWAGLSKEALTARQTLLKCPPDSFLYKYFMCAPRPVEASPDYYWYELAFTSLDVLVQEMTNAVKVSAIDTYQHKFPVDKNGMEDLTADQAARIYELSQMAGPAAAGGSATGSAEQVEKDDREIAAKLRALRDEASFPSWVRRIDVLPVCPDATYVCQVIGIKTSPPGLVRKIEIRKGRTMVSCRNEAGVDEWLADKEGVRAALAYDGSDDAIDLDFYALPGDQTPLDVQPRIHFAGPWAWHRMVKTVVPRDGAYDAGVKLADERGRAILITLTLRFCRTDKARDSAGESKPQVAVLEIFP